MKYHFTKEDYQNIYEWIKIAQEDSCENLNYEYTDDIFDDGYGNLTGSGAVTVPTSSDYYPKEHDDEEDAILSNGLHIDSIYVEVDAEIEVERDDYYVPYDGNSISGGYGGTDYDEELTDSEVKVWSIYLYNDTEDVMFSYASGDPRYYDLKPEIHLGDIQGAKPEDSDFDYQIIDKMLDENA